MNGPAASLLRRVLTAPFSRRTWAELGYVLVSVPLAVAGFAFTVVTALPPLLAAVSAPGMRKFGDASRGLCRELLGEDVPAPAARDRTAWRVRGYLVLKLPLAVAGLAAAACCWLGGLVFLAFPAWWALLPPPVATERLCRSGGACITFPAPPGGAITHGQVVLTVGAFHIADLADSLALVPFGAALLLAAPWLTRAVTAADRSLIRGLLGPASAADRVHALQETRARAVDDAAARLRGIERDLHDGTQRSSWPWR